MIPETLLLGHLLLALAAAAGVAAIAFTLGALRHKNALRGTPGYARGRTARRKAAYALAVAILLAIACYTPLGSISLAGGGR